jgi:hypothetical protein
MGIELQAQSFHFKCSTARKKVKVYDLRPHNIIRLQHAIGVYDWDPLLYSSSHITVAYDGFLNVINSMIESYVPSHIVTLGHRDPEYVTPLIKFMLGKRRILRKKDAQRKQMSSLTKSTV